MQTRDTREIFNDFLSTYAFTSVYREHNFPIAAPATNTLMAPGEAADFLVESALTGNKVIGFFNEPPTVRPKRLLRGECVFVSRTLPPSLNLPTLFCRYPEDIPEMLPLALKASFDAHMPVLVVLAENVIHNLTDAVSDEFDFDRVAPYIHSNTFAAAATFDEITAHLATAERLFAKRFPNPLTPKNGRIAFNDPNEPFFSYLVPWTASAGSESLKGTTALGVPAGEVAFLRETLNNMFGMNISFESYARDAFPDVMEPLCPGCPMVALASRVSLDGAIVFTDVACDAAVGALKLVPMTAAGYLGIISNSVNVPTVFVGNVSRFTRKFTERVHNGSVMLLADTPVGKDHPFPRLKHPSKLKNLAQTGHHAVFPYSCHTIQSSGSLKVKPKKCRCIPDGKDPVCIEMTRCPALVVSGETVVIDKNRCTGCASCKPVCPYGAIS